MFDHIFTRAVFYHNTYEMSKRLKFMNKSHFQEKYERAFTSWETAKLDILDNQIDEGLYA